MTPEVLASAQSLYTAASRYARRTPRARLVKAARGGRGQLGQRLWNALTRNKLLTALLGSGLVGGTAWGGWRMMGSPSLFAPKVVPSEAAAQTSSQASTPQDADKNRWIRWLHETLYHLLGEERAKWLIEAADPDVYPARYPIAGAIAGGLLLPTAAATNAALRRRKRTWSDTFMDALIGAGAGASLAGLVPLIRYIQRQVDAPYKIPDVPKPQPPAQQPPSSEQQQSQASSDSDKIVSAADALVKHAQFLKTYARRMRKSAQQPPYGTTNPRDFAHKVRHGREPEISELVSRAGESLRDFWNWMTQYSYQLPAFLGVSASPALIHWAVNAPQLWRQWAYGTSPANWVPYPQELQTFADMELAPEREQLAAKFHNWLRMALGDALGDSEASDELTLKERLARIRRNPEAVRRLMDYLRQNKDLAEFGFLTPGFARVLSGNDLLSDLLVRLARADLGLTEPDEVIRTKLDRGDYVVQQVHPFSALGLRYGYPSDEEVDASLRYWADLNSLRDIAVQRHAEAIDTLQNVLFRGGERLASRAQTAEQKAQELFLRAQRARDMAQAAARLLQAFGPELSVLDITRPKLAAGGNRDVLFRLRDAVLAARQLRELFDEEFRTSIAPGSSMQSLQDAWLNWRASGGTTGLSSAQVDRLRQLTRMLFQLDPSLSDTAVDSIITKFLAYPELTLAGIPLGSSNKLSQEFETNAPAVRTALLSTFDEALGPTTPFSDPLTQQSDFYRPRRFAVDRAAALARDFATLWPTDQSKPLRLGFQWPQAPASVADVVNLLREARTHWIDPAFTERLEQLSQLRAANAPAEVIRYLNQLQFASPAELRRLRTAVRAIQSALESLVPSMETLQNQDALRRVWATLSNQRNLFMRFPADAPQPGAALTGQLADALATLQAVNLPTGAGRTLRNQYVTQRDNFGAALDAFRLASNRLPPVSSLTDAVPAGFLTRIQQRVPILPGAKWFVGSTGAGLAASALVRWLIEQGAPDHSKQQPLIVPLRENQ